MTGSDVSKTLTVKVSSVTSAFAGASKTSAATAKVGKLSWATPPKLTVTGTAKVGKVLTGKTGTWSPSAKLAYQWYRDGKAIKGGHQGHSHGRRPPTASTPCTSSVTATRTGFASVSQKVGVKIA